GARRRALHRRRDAYRRACAEASKSRIARHLKSAHSSPYADSRRSGFGAKRGAAGTDFGGFALALRRRKSYNLFSPLHTFLPAQSHDKGVGRLKQTKATRCSEVAL